MEFTEEDLWLQDMFEANKWYFIDGWGRKVYLDFQRYDDYGMAAAAARQAAKMNGGGPWRLRSYKSHYQDPWGHLAYTIEVFQDGEWKTPWNDGKLR